MSSFGVLNTIRAPQLTSITQPNLIRFEVEYAAYKEQVTDINRTRSASNQILPAPIRQYLKPELLHSLCILGVIEDASTMEEASDGNVQKWFDSRLSESTRDAAERVRTAVDSVPFRQCREDPGGAVMEYVVNVITALDKANASDAVSDGEKTKNIIHKMIAKLQPPELRVRMSDEKAYWSSAEKSSVQHFMQRASTLAVDVNNGEIARAKLTKKDNQGGRNATPSFNKGETGKKAGNNPAGNKNGNDKGKKRKHADHVDKENPRNNDGNKDWDKPCLNPDCDEIHRISDCKKTSKKRRIELLDEYFRKIRSQKSAKSVSKKKQTSTERFADAENGRYDIIIEGKVSSVALGDYGADFSAIPLSLVERVCLPEPKVNLKPMKKKMHLSTAIKSKPDANIEFTASSTVELGVTINLPGSNLPVRIRGVTFLVVDQDMSEVLLGRPFLKAIGFDLNYHLQQVGKFVDGKHIAELETNCLKQKLASCTYKGMAYQEKDDDPIRLPETVAAGFGEDSKSSIDKEFERLEQQAEEGAISTEGLKRLTSLLQRYRGIFRLMFGADPPAKVMPLSIKLKAGARPYRSPQRRYARNQREFINKTVKELEEIGAVYKNPNSRWASPALAVPKPGTDKLRFTVDLRVPNSQTDRSNPRCRILNHVYRSVKGANFLPL